MGLLAAVAALLLALPLGAAAQSGGGPTIASDKADYAPGETVTLTGSGWASGEDVRIVVNDTIGQSWKRDVTVTASTGGTIVDTFSLPVYFVSNYDVTATGPVSGTATTTFTDAAIGTYDQCSNDTGSGYGSGDTGCRWINGNLQSNNSIYVEGDATVQRLWLTDFVPGSSHTVRLNYGTTKGGKHAYDFLTTWDWSEDWITVADRCQGVTGCGTAPETALDIPEDPNVPNSFEPTAPGDRQFRMRGGTLNSATTPAIASGSYAGDSETVITISFTVASSGAMCTTKQDVTTCDVALWFGAHVSTQANWGLGQGAGSISGSPYHVALDATDGASVGQRDNQMQAGVVTAIPNGTIVIVKDAIPNDAQDFGFNLTNNATISQAFSLDDDADPTLPNSQIFSVPPGTWSASELSPMPTGWSLTSLSCVDPTSNTTVDLATRAASINLASSETVVCTFTNTRAAARIIVQKTTVPAGSTQSFDFTPSYGSGFSLTDGGSNTSAPLAPGSGYSVAETVPVGWTQTSAVCSDGSPVTNIELTAGETVTCTFTNTQKGRIIVRKVTDPAGATDSFTFSPSWGASFALTDGQSHDSGLLVPGAYSVSETVATGWSLDAATCDDGSAPGAIDLGAGETVTCTFENLASQADIALSTQATLSGGDLTDTLTITGFDGVHPITGTVDFAVCGPTDAAAECTTGGTTVGTTVPLAADGTASTSEAFTPTTPGWYCFRADFTSTSPFYGDRSHTNATTECALVTADLSVTKTAAGSYDRTYGWTIAKAVDQTRIEIAENGTATASYTVTVTPTGHQDSGWELGGTITVTNPNVFAVEVDVTDAYDGGGTCTVAGGTDVTVPAHGSVPLTYSCSFATQPVYTGINTALITWDQVAAGTPTGSDTGTATVALTLDDETNATITVIDDQTDPSAPVTLGTADQADGPTPFEYSLDLPGVAGTCTPYTNTAVIDETDQTASQFVTVCVGQDLAVTKTADATFDRTYLWKIAKDASATEVAIAEGGTATVDYDVTVTPDGVADDGYTLGGTITIANPNDWQNVTVAVADTLDAGGSCTITEAAPYVVPADGQLLLHYTCTTDGTTTENTATVTWNAAAFHTPTGSDSDTVDVDFALDHETNKTITVIDDQTDPDAPVVLGSWTWTDGPHTFSYRLQLRGVAGTCIRITNTALIDETDQSASHTVTVCVAQDLVVTKTAAGTFDRAYLWSIAKSADDTRVTIADGGQHTFHYTVAVDQTGVSDSGWTLGGTITISNPNDFQAITLTGLSDSVDNGGACTVAAGPYVVPADGSLDVGYTCTYASAPSADSGTNTATATWDKAAAHTPSGSDSGTADFTLAQQGSANKTVHVTDSFAGDLGTVTATDAAPFASATFGYDRTESGVAGTCTRYDNTATIPETGQPASKDVTLCVAKDLTASKTADATFERAYTWDITKDADRTMATIAEGGSTTFRYTVVASQTGRVDSGWHVSGTITVTNPNDFEAIVADVRDSIDIGGGADCLIALDGQAVNPAHVTVPKGETIQLGYACTFTGTPSRTGLNHVNVDWDKDTYHTPTGQVLAQAPVDFAITKRTNETVHVTDTVGGALGTVDATDDGPLATASFTYERTVSGTPGTCRIYDNTATIVETEDTASKDVEVCVGSDLTVAKTAKATFDKTYGWTVAKAADQTRFEIAGGKATAEYTVTVGHDAGTLGAWRVKGVITVTNPNDFEDVTVDVTDAIDGGGDCTVTGGTNAVVPMSSSIELGYTCTFDQAPTVDAGDNHVTVTWDKAAASTPHGTASGTSPFAFDDPKVLDECIDVTDSMAGSLGTVCVGDANPTAFTYSRQLDGTAGTCVSHDNTARFATNDNGASGSASETVTVCQGKDLTVSKTADPTYARKYLWSIDKSVDKTLVKKASGTATFNYTVVAAQTGIDDRAFKVTGTITVTNPNDWQAVTVDVSDAVDNGGSCTIDGGGTGISVAKSDTKSVGYTCTWDGEPSSRSGLNTATVTWDASAASTPSGSAEGTRAFAFGDPTSFIKKTVTVTDTFNGTTTTLGTVTGTDAAPWATKTFSYSRTIAIPADGCKSYTNTARIVDTSLEDSVTVTVCGPELTGARTIGFWQNKNGQSIIKNGASTASVCSSGTWLRQYAPFGDMNASATCTQVASYVTNVIKAADASGASMNAMLKAQMLATALDVYFSDPALGGNKLGAPEPIGGVTIDLTKVCATAGSCTSYIDASGAFGGASTMTVQQTLSYAASKSNVGGSTWYGNVKTTQEKAKDVFDAINNEVALGG